MAHALGDVAIHKRVTKACSELVDALCDFWLDDGFHDGGDDYDDFEAARSAIVTLLTPLTATGMDNPPDVSELAPYFVDGEDGYPLHEIVADVDKLKKTLAYLVFTRPPTQS